MTYKIRDVFDDGHGGKLAQDSLFDEPVVARHTDPETSKEAAKIVKVGVARRRILAILARPEHKSGLNTLEIAHKLNRQRDTISSHMTRLEEAGYVRRNGVRERKIVWQWTEVEWPGWGATDVEWESAAQTINTQGDALQIVEDALKRRGYRKMFTHHEGVKYPPNTIDRWSLWINPTDPRNVVVTMVNALGHRCYFIGEDSGTRLWEQY